MEAVIDFLSAMPVWYWFILALVLLILELTTGTTYLLWPAAAAAIVGLCFPIAGLWWAQFGLFGAATIGLTLVGPTHIAPWIKKTQSDHFDLNTGMAKKVGQIATVEADFITGRGKVRLGDTSWLAQSQGGEDFAAGARVVVSDVDGMKLIVAQAG